MNVLSEAIKVSSVFAQRDGWQFDDYDEKLYADPEWTGIPVIWQIFWWLFALPCVCYCWQYERKKKTQITFLNTLQDKYKNGDETMVKASSKK